MLTVPMICQPLSSQPIDVCTAQYQHLSDLDLADFPAGDTSNMEIDLLIKSNYYWELVTGETRRGESGPIAFKTRLGWVHSGPVPDNEVQQSSVSLLTIHVLRIASEHQKFG